MASLNNNNNMMVTGGKAKVDLPPGYRFHPSDDQVILYLRQMVFDSKLPADIIPTLPNLYGLNPEEIPLAEYKYDMEHQTESGLIHQWFFFTTKLEGQISTKGGYWQVSEPPTPVEDREEDTIIGFKQAVYFYKGIFPDGIKSNWSAYEYRLNLEEFEDSKINEDAKYKVQNFVACRILKHKNVSEARV